MSAESSHVIPLGEASDVARAGAKAVNLARLRTAGFRVPDGYVLVADAFAMHAADGVPSTLPTDILDALERALVSVGTPVAVRSSGIAEDLAGASFAGQYETVLDVEGSAHSPGVWRAWRFWC